MYRTDEPFAERRAVPQVARPFADPSTRGFVPLYHQDIENRCPGCGKSHWHIGRFSAECAHCDTALPFAMVSSQPMAPRFTERFSSTAH